MASVGASEHPRRATEERQRHRGEATGVADVAHLRRQSDLFSDQQLWDVVAFIRSLGTGSGTEP